jgi:hypothetical protein
LRGALVDGEDLAIPATGDDMALALTWRDEVYVSPIDARTYRAEGWQAHPPEQGEAAAARLSGEIHLFTSDDDIMARTTPEELAAFCQQIKLCAERMLTQHDGAEIVLRVGCLPQGHAVDLSGKGAVPPDVMQAFFDAIKALPPLRVSGEVSFEMRLSVA